MTKTKQKKPNKTKQIKAKISQFNNHQFPILTNNNNKHNNNFAALICFYTPYPIIQDEYHYLFGPSLISSLARYDNTNVIQSHPHLLAQLDPPALTPSLTFQSAAKFIGRMNPMARQSLDGPESNGLTHHSTLYSDPIVYDARFLMPALRHSLGVAISQRQPKLLEQVFRSNIVSYALMGLSSDDRIVRRNSYEMIVGLMGVMEEEGNTEFAYTLQVRKFFCSISVDND
jgi:hypothetical protein